MSVVDALSIVGKKVYDLSGRYIGEVKDVLVDENSLRVTAIVVDNMNIPFSKVVGARDIVIIEKIEIRTGR